MNELRRCTRCVMPETWPGITFDQDGVCGPCRQAEKKVDVDWGKRQRELESILTKYSLRAIDRGTKYSCLLGYSGGKDSVYSLWAMVKKYNMVPLVVTFDHGFRLSEDAEYNLMEIPKKLDCDHIRFTLGNGLRNALCKKASEVMQDWCWHCHNGVGALPARISMQWDVPLQVWGESPSDYETHGINQEMEEQNEEHFKKVFQAGVTAEQVVPEGYIIDDLLPMTWPTYGDDWTPEQFLLKAIYLGNYDGPWDQREHVRIITEELGWRQADVEGTYVRFDKVDCPYEPVRDWMKFLKLGFGRTTFQASKDVRAGLITRNQALALVERYDGRKPKVLNDFLEETGMTEEEFGGFKK